MSDLQLKTIPLSFTASGDNTLITGLSGRKIRVFKMWLVVAADVTVTFKDGTGTNLSGAAPLTANGAITLDNVDGVPWFTTSTGNGLVVNLNAAVQCSGMAYYRDDE